jgi:hypothetical protein
MNAPAGSGAVWTITWTLILSNRIDPISYRA